jgi:hypothetical protein
MTGSSSAPVLASRPLRSQFEWPDGFFDVWNGPAIAASLCQSVFVATTT